MCRQTSILFTSYIEKAYFLIFLKDTNSVLSNQVIICSSRGSSVPPADVPPVPAGCDQSAEPLRPLHRAGGKAVEKCSVITGAEPAGALYQLQTCTVQLLKT